jgi:hypothetical protein
MPSLVMFLKAIGIIHIDKRWAKVPQKELSYEDFAITNFLIPANIKQNFTSINIFSSTREPLSISHICDEGVYLQFELPTDALPSFTGLAGTITYLITISLQFPTDTIRSHFPFRVYGHGSHLSYPHHNPFPLCSFAASSRSYESFISSLTSSVVSLAHTPGADYYSQSNDQDDDGRNSNDDDQSPPYPRQPSQEGARANKISFSISDLDTICLMTFSGIERSSESDQGDPSFIGSIESGDTIWVNIDFNSSKQTCEMLKLKLIQRECHADGSRLQVTLVKFFVTHLSLLGENH